MNSKTLFFITILVSLLFTSCEMSNEIEYDTYFSGESLVVKGFLSSKDGINLIVKKTLSPSDIYGNDTLESANIYLLKNGIIEQELSSLNNYNFTNPNNIIFNPTDKYQIQVESTNFNTSISTEQMLVSSTPIDSITTEGDNFYSRLKVSVFFNHLDNEQGYFIKAHEYKEGIALDSIGYEEHFFSPGTIINPDITGLQAFHFQVDNRELDSIKVRLYTLSKDLITYYKSIDENEMTSESPFFDYIAPVFSNIENGHGIFATYEYDTKTYIID